MKTVVEVGANWGDDTERLLDGGRNRVYAFEPAPELLPKLRARFSDRENVSIFPNAVDLESGERWFHVTETPDHGASSLYGFNEEVAGRWDPRCFRHGARHLVQTVRLDHFLRLHSIDWVDYLWIDAQGNDFRVLQSLGDMVVTVQAGKCEAAYRGNLYAGTENGYREISAWLKWRGFEVLIVPDGALIEADIHFRRVA